MIGYFQHVFGMLVSGKVTDTHHLQGPPANDGNLYIVIHSLFCDVNWETFIAKPYIRWMLIQQIGCRFVQNKLFLDHWWWLRDRNWCLSSYDFRSFHLDNLSWETCWVIVLFVFGLKMHEMLIYIHTYLWGGSINRGTPKSSILIGFSIINYPFWGILFLEISIYVSIWYLWLKHLVWTVYLSMRDSWLGSSVCVCARACGYLVKHGEVCHFMG